MTKGVKEKLDERGYWRVEIRPVEFIAQRVDSLPELRRLVETTRVQLRGWDFPHIGRTWDVPASQNSIGVDTDWSSHVELWRAFLSGQFVYRGGVFTDWQDQDHFPEIKMPHQMQQGVGIVDSVWTLTEFLEFAARWSQTKAGDNAMRIRVSFHKLQNRALFGDHPRRRWHQAYGPARMDVFRFDRELTAAELISDSSAIAVKCASEFFEVFGYEADREVLHEIQSELLTLRTGT